jgi:AcrR family transcriptional regulator
MENKQPPKKPRISSAEAQQRLIDTVIEIVETAPLQQLTVRNIAKHAGTDPKTIFRNFESLEELFVAAVRELEQRMRTSLEAGEGDLRPVAPAIPYVRLTTWLYLSGTPIEKLQGSLEATAIHRALTLGDLDSRSDLGERTKATLFLIMSAFLAGQATVGQFQPQIFTPSATLDAVNLITALIEDLPRLTDLLGWNHESEET